jgi:hypothetical protein
MPRTLKITLTASGWRIVVLLLLTVAPWGVGVLALVVAGVNALRH